MDYNSGVEKVLPKIKIPASYSLAGI
jgi:hypothetical protein